MNVYDFDKTIYAGDSSIDFYLYCVRKNVRILKYVFVQAAAAVRYVMGKWTKTQMKERFYIFLRDMNTDDDFLKRFWNSHKHKIKRFYLENKKSDDIIISASPEFLLKPVCEELGVRLIASRVNQADGAYTGENCYGNDKVERLRAEYGDVSIECFYSDSLSDTPLAEIAHEAFIVDGERIMKWPVH